MSLINLGSVRVLFFKEIKNVFSEDAHNCDRDSEDIYNNDNYAFFK